MTLEKALEGEDRNEIITDLQGGKHFSRRMAPLFFLCGAVYVWMILVRMAARAAVRVVTPRMAGGIRVIAVTGHVGHAMA